MGRPDAQGWVLASENLTPPSVRQTEECLLKISHLRSRKKKTKLCKVNIVINIQHETFEMNIYATRLSTFKQYTYISNKHHIVTRIQRSYYGSMNSRFLNVCLEAAWTRGQAKKWQETISRKDKWETRNGVRGASWTLKRCRRVSSNGCRSLCASGSRRSSVRWLRMLRGRPSLRDVSWCWRVAESRSRPGARFSARLLLFEWSVSPDVSHWPFRCCLCSFMLCDMRIYSFVVKDYIC